MKVLPFMSYKTCTAATAKQHTLYSCQKTRNCLSLIAKQQRRRCTEDAMKDKMYLLYCSIKQDIKQHLIYIIHIQYSIHTSYGRLVGFHVRKAYMREDNSKYYLFGRESSSKHQIGVLMLLCLWYLCYVFIMYEICDGYFQSC